MRDSHNLSAFRKEFFQIFYRQYTVFANVEHFENGFFALAKQLPGNDIAVMFGHRNYDLVSLVDKRFTKGEGHEVDGSCCSGSEYDFFPGRSMQEFLHDITRAFVGVGGLSRQMMNSPVDVGILFQRQFLPQTHHRQRPLGRSSIVQIHQGFPVYATGEDGKL